MIPDHISPSQYSQYKECPRKWYLGKLKEGWEVQAWYTAVGTAVHRSVEDRLKGKDFSVYQHFYDVVQGQMNTEPDRAEWMFTFDADDQPLTEARALARAQECYDRVEARLADFTEILAVEVDLTGDLPGLCVPAVGIADVIGVHRSHGVTVGDWKTGKTKPKGSWQLKTYKALDAVSPEPYGISTGLYLMLHPESPSPRPVDLSEVDPRQVGEEYQAVRERMEGRYYEAKPGFQCRFCFQRLNCDEASGPTARTMYYDRSAEDGYPF